MDAKTFNAEPINSAGRETLWQLFRNGPTWDGDLASKSGRSWLVDHGFAERGDGWNWLNSAGVLLALELGMGRRKEARH